MTDGPRVTHSGSYVLFMAYPSPHAPGLVAWTQFRALVDRGAGVSAPRDQRIPRGRMLADHHAGIWRLLASNNREIARCAFIYGSFASARENVVNLQASLDDVSITTIHGPTSGTHGWFASMDHHVMVTCARWYETDSVSMEAGEGAIAALRCAVITEQAREFSSATGSRHPAGVEHSW